MYHYQSTRNESNDTCLSDSFTASSCCSLHTESFYVNASHGRVWTEYLSDLIDGTVSFHFVDFYEFYYNL